MYLQYLLFLSGLNETRIFSFQKIIQISNFIKIRPVGAELFHVDRWMDMMKLTVTFFCNFANTPKNS